MNRRRLLQHAAMAVPMLSGCAWLRRDPLHAQFGLINRRTFSRQSTLLQSEHDRVVSLRSADNRSISFDLDFPWKQGMFGPFLRFTGITGSGRHLILGLTRVDAGMPAYYLGFVDLQSTDDRLMLNSRLPRDVRTSYDGSVMVGIHDKYSRNDQPHISLRYSTNGQEWHKIADFYPPYPLIETYGVVADGSEVVYAHRGVVYFHNLKAGKRIKVAEGEAASCSGDGRYFSYRNHDDYLVYGRCDAPDKVTRTPLLVVDGMEWAPDGSRGLIAQPFSIPSLFSLTSRHVVVSFPSLTTMRIGGDLRQVPIAHHRWLLHPERLPQRLPQWLKAHAAELENHGLEEIYVFE